MTGDPSQAPTEADAAFPPEAPQAPQAAQAARDSLPFPFWLLFGLGAFSCATWIGAALLDVSGQAGALAQIWPLVFVRAALVLTVPAVILLFLRSSRMPARRHPLALLLVEAFVALIAALPALLPLTTPGDLGSLPLRVPTLSLGVALAAVDPLVIERWRRSDARDSLTATTASLGFGAAVIAFIIAYDASSLGGLGSPQCASGIWTGCGQQVA